MKLQFNFAAMVFLGIFAFLIWQHQAFSLLATIEGIAFAGIGLLVSGGLIGLPVTALHRKYALRLIKGNSGELNQSISNKIRFTGTVAMLFQVLAIFYGTEHVLNRVL